MICGIIAAAPEVEEDTEVAELLRRYVPSVSLQAVPGGGKLLQVGQHVVALDVRHPQRDAVGGGHPAPTR